jgi:diazepam-binding inhibitor (GABA receptor modulator, acyl-CoA-binding protein)
MHWSLVKEPYRLSPQLSLQLPDNVTDDDKLALYGLYKQATEGDVSTARPGLFDLKGKAKWDAYNAQKGKSTEEAMQEYIMLVDQLFEKYS